MSDLISLIVPCYNEQEALPFFYEEICKVSSQLKKKYNVDFEFIFVNDGSRDQTLQMLRDLSSTDSRVKYISFSRNFGKEGAIYAGLENASGDYISIIDADLQDPPSLLLQMYELIRDGEHDCIGTRRVTRKGEPPIRSFFARCFYRIINKISNVDVVDGARDFRLMTRQMADAILSLREYNRFSKGIFGWVGFRTKWLEYENVERVAGSTKWSFWKLFIYSLDGITAFSTTPLSIASAFGMLFLFIAFILILFIIWKTLVFGEPVAGYPSTMCVMFFIGGLQLFSIGILGQYLSKAYLEVKRRPIYIVQETNIEDIKKGLSGNR